MTQSDPIASVVMVSYNHARYLRRVMDCVFNQTIANLDIILIDNGSSDGSNEIIASFTDNRLRVIHQQNLGLSVALNIGIDLARGSFIALGNTDDEWALNKIELQLEAIKRHKAGVCFSAARLVDDNSNPIKGENTSRSPFFFENLPQTKLFEKFFFNTNFMCATSALIDAEILNGERFDPVLLQLQDFDLWVGLVKKTEFYTVPQELVSYRVRTDGENLSLDKRNRARVLFELNRVYRHFFDGVKIEFFKEAFAKHLKTKALNEENIEFEKVFLYLKMQEPSIRAVGLDLLYNLFSTQKGRDVADIEYGMRINDIWDTARMPLFNDSQSMQGALLEAEHLAERLAAAESELTLLKKSMQQITSGKLWKLREKVYGILKGR